MTDWLDAQLAAGALDVPALLDGKAGELLHEMAGAGALVSLGLTGDGGALGVTITVDGRWRREYFRDSEALADWLAEGLEPAKAAAEVARTARASSGSRKRSRGL